MQIEMNCLSNNPQMYVPLTLFPLEEAGAHPPCPPYSHHRAGREHQGVGTQHQGSRQPLQQLLQMPQAHRVIKIYNIELRVSPRKQKSESSD